MALWLTCILIGFSSLAEAKEGTVVVNSGSIQVSWNDTTEEINAMSSFRVKLSGKTDTFPSRSMANFQTLKVDPEGRFDFEGDVTVGQPEILFHTVRADGTVERQVFEVPTPKGGVFLGVPTSRLNLGQWARLTLFADPRLNSESFSQTDAETVKKISSMLDLGLKLEVRPLPISLGLSYGLSLGDLTNSDTAHVTSWSRLRANLNYYLILKSQRLFLDLGAGFSFAEFISAPDTMGYKNLFSPMLVLGLRYRPINDLTLSTSTWFGPILDGATPLPLSSRVLTFSLGADYEIFRTIQTGVFFDNYGLSLNFSEVVIKHSVNAFGVRIGLLL